MNSKLTASKHILSQGKPGVPERWTVVSDWEPGLDEILLTNLQ